MFRIRKFKKADTRKVALLIIKTFRKFNTKKRHKKGAVQKYINYYDTKKNSFNKLYKNISKTPIFFLAIDKEKIVGIIRGKSQRIINLYVDGGYQKKGIGKALINKFEKEARKNKSKEIKIRASSYAVPFYKKMGYKKTTGIRFFIGLIINPMKKSL